MAAADGYQVRLFGPPQIMRGGHPVEFRARRSLALAGVVLCERRPMSRAALASMLWPDAPDPAANLRPVLSELRHRTPELLLITRTTVEPNPQGDITVDVHDLETAIGRANPTSSGAVEHVSWLERLVDAATGELLEGLELRGVEPFEHWVQVERLRADHRLGTARHLLTEHHIAMGRLDRAIELSAAAAARLPYDDAVHEQLVRILLRAGRRTEAITRAEDFVRVLERDLGVPPHRSFDALIASIRSTSELEVHRAVGVGAIDHLATTGPLIGRSEELDHVVALLRRSHLVTITGIDGSGKTRLAVEAARRATARHPDGVVFIDLSDVSEPTGVVHVVASALRLGLDAGSIEDRIAEYLSGLDALIVLDGCEQVIVETARLVDTLLRTADSLRILVSSHRPLDVAGETVVPLAPLSTADGGPAGDLLLGRARALGHAVRTDTGTRAEVDALCRRVDGLPLAIEVLAGLLDRRSIAELLQEFETSSVTVQLTDVMGSSLRFLSSDARHLFAHLGGFAGSFDAKAAAALTHRRLENAGDALDELRRDSILSSEVGPAGDTRFRLLGIVAAHARFVAGDALPDLLGRHAEHYADRVSGLDLFDLRDADRTDVLRPDLENLSQAFEYFSQRGEWAVATEIAIGCYGVFSSYAWTRRGRAWLERCLQHRAELDRSAVERLLGSLVQLCLVLDDNPAIERYASQLADAEDPRIRAEATGTRALPILQTDPERAGQLLDDAVGALSMDSPPGSWVWPRAYLGFRAMYEGALTVAIDHFDASIAEGRLLGHTSHLWILEDSAASCELMLGLPDAVLRRLDGGGRPPSFWDARHLLVGLALLETGDLARGRDEILLFASPAERGRLPRSANDALVGLARLAAAEGRPDHAVELLGSAGRGRMPATIGVGRRLAADLGATDRVADRRAQLEAEGRLYASADALLAEEWRQAMTSGQPDR